MSLEIALNGKMSVSLLWVRSELFFHSMKLIKLTTNWLTAVLLGSLRSTPETDDTITDHNVISLNILAAGYISTMQDDW